MGREIRLVLPDSVYSQVETVARRANRPVAEVVADAVASAFPPLDVNQGRLAMQSEASAYQAMHAELWQHYPGQYVAIYQGAVVDHDKNEVKLLERVEQRYPEEVVLIRQVQATLPGDLVVRSPRFVENV